MNKTRHEGGVSQLQAQTGGVKLSVSIDVLKKYLRPSTIRGVEQMLAGEAVDVLRSKEDIRKWFDTMHGRERKSA